MRSKFINHEDVQKLKACLTASEWLPLQVSLETGLRIDDVLTLKGSALRRERSGQKRPFLRFTAHKTGKSGDAFISESLFAKLQRQRTARDAFLFPSYGKSGHLTRQAAWQRMKRAASRAGVSSYGTSPHSLRKAFAVALRHENGLEAVRRALQHSNSAVTAVYAFADTVCNASPDEPIRWREVEFLVDYILERLTEKENTNKCSR